MKSTIRITKASRHFSYQGSGLAAFVLLSLGCPGVALASDTDLDGIPNWLDNCTQRFNPQQLDSDGDLYGNDCDGDLDNDGLVTTLDYALLLASTGTADRAGDFVRDGVITTADAEYFVNELFGAALGPSGQVAMGATRIRDVYLHDMDADGFDELGASPTDLCPGFYNFAGNGDVDGDGIGDGCDLCLHVDDSSTPGVDTDGDGIGNACDADYNNDGFVNTADFAVFYDCFVTGGLAAETGCLVADANGDGSVSTVDWGAFLRQYLAGAPGESGLACADPTAPGNCPRYGQLYGSLNNWLGTLTHVTNTLHVEDVSSLTNLNGLENLASVGALRIASNPDLSALSGLDNLVTVSRYISIEDNPVLVTTQGLLPESAEPTSVRIMDNPLLADLRGLAHLEALDSLLLIGNGALTSVDDLAGLTELGELAVYDSPVLEDLDGLSGLTTADAIVLWDNAGLVSIGGLRGLSSLEEVYIRDNPLLASLDGLDNLTGISDRLWVINSPALETLAPLSGVSGPVSDLLLSDLPLIEDLDGLEQITDADFVVISRNDALLSLDGLQGLESVRLLTISNNDSLTTVGNMRRLASVGYLSVLLNPALEEVDGLAGVSGPISLLHVESNDQLKDVDGLSGLTEAAVVELGSNASLLSIAGLFGLQSAQAMYIYDNPQLCADDVDTLLTMLSSSSSSMLDSINSDNSGLCP